MSTHAVSSTDNIDNVTNEAKIDDSLLGKLNGIFDFAEDIFDVGGDLISLVTGKQTTDETDKNEIAEAFNKTANDFASKLAESNLLPKGVSIFIKENTVPLAIGVLFLVGVGIFMAKR